MDRHPTWLTPSQRQALHQTARIGQGQGQGEGGTWIPVHGRGRPPNPHRLGLSWGSLLPLPLFYFRNDVFYVRNVLMGGCHSRGGPPSPSGGATGQVPRIESSAPRIEPMVPRIELCVPIIEPNVPRIELRVPKI
jgi:hypothetical protein